MWSLAQARRLRARAIYICRIRIIGLSFFRTFANFFLRTSAFRQNTKYTRTHAARADTLVEVSARSVHSGARGGRSKFYIYILALGAIGGSAPPGDQKPQEVADLSRVVLEAYQMCDGDRRTVDGWRVFSLTESPASGVKH